MLNIRGKDNFFSPIPNCNAIINDKKKIILIVDNKKISKNFKSQFGKNLKYLNPSNIIKYLNSLDSKENFLIDKITCSLFYKEKIAKKFKYVEKIDPIFFLKSKKKKRKRKTFFSVFRSSKVLICCTVCLLRPSCTFLQHMGPHLVFLHRVRLVLHKL